MVPDASMITACVSGLFGVIMCVMAEFADKPGPRILEDRIAVMVR